MFSKDDITKKLAELQKQRSTTIAVPEGDEQRKFVFSLLSADADTYLVKLADGSIFQRVVRKDRFAFRAVPVFSHEDLADAFAYSEIRSSYTIERVSAAILPFLVRKAILSGVYLAYNDGAEATVFDPLSVFSYIRDYYAKDELISFDDELKDSFSFIRAIRHNAVYKLSSISSDADKPFIVDVATGAARVEVSSVETETSAFGMFVHPLSIQCLWYLSGDIHVSASEFKSSYNAELLKKILLFTGIVVPRVGYSKEPAFKNERPVQMYFSDLVLQDTLDISMALIEKVAEQSGTDVLSIGFPVLGAGNANASEEDEPLFDFEPTIEPTPIDVTKKQPYYKEERKKRIRTIYPSGDGMARTRKKLLLYALVPFAVAMIILAVVFLRQVRDDRYVTFSAYLNSGKYAEASDVYHSAKDPDKYNSCVTAAVRQVVLDYANDTISAAEATDRLEKLGEYPKQASAVGKAEADIEQISESRHEFELGERERDRSEKLLHWSKVNSLDIANYKMISEFAKTEKSENTACVLDEIEHAGVKDRVRIEALVDFYYRMYPDDKALVAETFEQYVLACAETWDHPVAINSLLLEKVPENNSLRLFIKWENRSGRVIRYIDYYFEFLDENGNVVPCVSGDDEQEKLAFMGREPAGFYPDGYKTPEGRKHGWVDIWVGAGDVVESVRLFGVELLYDDGDGEFVVISDRDQLDAIWVAD